MPYSIAYTTAFKKDVKVARKRGKNLDKLFSLIEQISSGEVLSPARRDHGLTGNWDGTRECHIEPDWP